jgi:endonuclease YncB( thermonuclease family)
MNSSLIRFAAILLLAFFAHAGIAQADSGKVVRVVDGDTVDVLVQGKSIRIRLAEIDAPEKRQAFGARARQALSTLVFGKVVDIKGRGKDRYGRLVGRIFESGLDINAEMVRQGYAWVYRQYLKDKNLLILETRARNEKRGLWADPGPVPPWKFRRTSRTHRK